MAATKLPPLVKEHSMEMPSQEVQPGIIYDQDTQVFRRGLAPHDLHQVYEEISHQIADIEMRLHSIDRDFYGNANERHFIKRVAAMIKPLQDITDVMAISSRKDMENIMMAIKDKMAEVKLDEPVARLEGYNKKLNFYVPKCLKLMQEVYALTRETEKYCQSFYDAENMVELGTAKDYEDSRKIIYQSISDGLKKLKSMWQKYDGGAGLELPIFSPNTGGLALECECTRQLFMLMFPEVRDAVYEGAEKLREWVRSDKAYITYLEGDKVYLDENVVVIDQELQAAKARYHNVVATIDVLNEQLEDSQRNFGSSNVKDMLRELNSEDTALRGKLRELSSMLHGYSSDRTMIKKRIRERPHISDTKENRERIELLSSQIVSLEHEIRQLKYDIKRVSQKLLIASEFDERKTLLEDKRDKALKQKRDLEELIKNMTEKHTKMSAQADLADAIIRIKASPTAAYNIYYNLARKPTDQDPVRLACSVVSKHIRHKWPVLYRSLPFQGRGQLEIDLDVKEITDKSRVTTADRATRALQKWRRYNAKASIGDIKKALNKIQEPQLWTRVQKITKLDENMYEEEEEEEELKHVPVHLRPFYLMIERFDDMTRRIAEEQARQRQKEELLKKYSSTNQNNAEAKNPAAASASF